MAKKRVSLMLNATVIAASLAGFALPAGAAGLGRLTVLSGLGQPLQAEVELTATADELSSLSARLASHDAFRRANIEYASALAGIRLGIAQRPDGRSVVRITSDRPMNEPFLDLLLELNWAAGRLVREYTFLLDPPTAPRARQSVQPVAVPEARPVAPAPTVAARTPATPAAGRAVQRGDTLHRIAVESRYDDVTVDQMLVGIYRANPDAFDGNMNRLRAGAILDIPSREAVTAVAGPDARRVVMAQASDYGVYRERLAGAVAAAPAAKSGKAERAAAGQITAKVEEQAPAPAEAKDQLKVSKAEAAGKQAGAASDRAAQARITALEEDLIAKEKSLKESQSRIAELEKNIRDLQKLMELKNQNLAELQKQAEAKPEAAVPVPAAKPEAAAPKAEVAAPKPEVAAPPPAVEAKPAEPPKAAEVAKAPEPAAPKPAAKPAAPPPPPPPEPGILDVLLDNPLLLAAGGGALLAGLGFAGYRMRQRRGEAFSAPPTTTAAPSIQPQSVFGATGGQSVDTSASSIQTDFSQSGLTAIDADEGVDPVAEADVYMAYGRDAQAEEILLDALKNEPTRHAIHVKLLEIYAQRKSTKQFETLASELYAQTGGAGAEWDKAVVLGRKVDPTNPLFGGGAAADSATTSPAERTVVSASPEKLRDTWTMPGELGQIANQVEGAEAAPAAPAPREEPVSSADATTVVLPESPLGAAARGGAGEHLDLDFDLDIAPTAPAVEPPQAGKPAGEAAPLDFDLGLDFSSGKAGEGAVHPSAEETIILDPGMAQRALNAVDVSLDEDLTVMRPRGEPAVDFDLGQAGGTGTPKPDLVADSESTDVRGNVIDIDFDKPGAGKPEAAQVVDLEHTDIGANLMQFGEDRSAPAGDNAVVDLERTDYDGRVLDFNFQLDERAPAPPPAEVVTTIVPGETLRAIQEVDLSGIDLDLGEPAPASAEAGQADQGGDPEVTTKLELALAYEEMGDKEGARELLEEVLKEGSEAQQQRAKELLARLA